MFCVQLFRHNLKRIALHSRVVFATWFMCQTFLHILVTFATEIATGYESLYQSENIIAIYIRFTVSSFAQ